MILEQAEGRGWPLAFDEWVPGKTGLRLHHTDALLTDIFFGACLIAAIIASLEFLIRRRSKP